jgi:hypothetical protein
MKFLFFNLTFFVAELLWAGPLFNQFDGVRPTGMGNAFIALADDANALWYNPAGLADIQGVHVNLFNFVVGVDSADTLNRLGNALFKGETENLIRQDKEYLRFNFFPSLITPHFGISLFSQTQGYFDISDLASQGLEVHSFHDQGLIAGGAFSLSDYLSFGVSVRAFYRAEVDLSLTSQEVIDQYGANAANLLNNIYSELSNRAGHGYGFGINSGIKLNVPLKSKGKNSPRLYLAATADDIGNTTLRAQGNNLAPKVLKQSFNFGGALVYPFSKIWTWNLTADVRHAFEPTDFIKLLHLGTELKTSVFGFRAGANQGYLTYGFSLEFPPHTRLHFSSYGVELGQKRWEREQRWYLVQLNIGFNPN